LVVLIFIAGGSYVQAATNEYKLKNDLTVVYEHIPGTQIVSVQAWVKTGSVNETPANSGISHFLEHILFKGTKNYGPDEIDNVVESHGGLMNAGTSKDYTTYYITLPTEHAETAYKVIADMVFLASFIPEEIEKEKPVVVQEIQRKYDNPTYEMWYEMMAGLYADTPYAMEVIGTEDNVNGFTPEELRGYYKSHYHPANTTLVIVGDIPADKAKTLAEKYFGLSSDVKPATGYESEWKVSAKTPQTKVFESDIAQDYALLGWQAPGVAVDAPVYEVLTEILSGGELSLLNRELKNKGLVTAISSGEMLFKNAGGYLVHMIANPDESDEAIKALEALLARVTKGEIPADELQKAKNRLLSRTVFRKEKASSEASEIGYSYTLEINDYYNTYASRINAVTAEDVAKTASIIFSAPRYTYKTVPQREEVAP
jgi:predicted Zn-dependent peptidase